MVSKHIENNVFIAFFLALLIKNFNTTRRVAMENQERENKTRRLTEMP